jgi:hypothetical protein
MAAEPETDRVVHVIVKVWVMVQGMIREPRDPIADQQSRGFVAIHVSNRAAHMGRRSMGVGRMAASTVSAATMTTPMTPAPLCEHRAADQRDSNDHQRHRQVVIESLHDTSPQVEIGLGLATCMPC